MSDLGWGGVSLFSSGGQVLLYFFRVVLLSVYLEPLCAVGAPRLARLNGRGRHGAVYHAEAAARLLEHLTAAQDTADAPAPQRPLPAVLPELPSTVQLLRARAMSTLRSG